MTFKEFTRHVILKHAVRTGLKDHLQTLNLDAEDCLKSYVLSVVVHKVRLMLMNKLVYC